MIKKPTLLAAVLALVAGLTVSTGGQAAATTCTRPRLLSIDDTRGYEGTAAPGSPGTPFTFTVTSSGCARAGRVFYSTVPGYASFADFTPTQAVLSFADGDMAPRTITVLVTPDSLGEPTEDFGVRLCPSADPITLSRDTARGSVLNDDGLPVDWLPPPLIEFHCSE
jgi:hypothetical protein